MEGPGNHGCSCSQLAAEYAEDAEKFHHHDEINLMIIKSESENLPNHPFREGSNWLAALL